MYNHAHTTTTHADNCTAETHLPKIKQSFKKKNYTADPHLPKPNTHRSRQSKLPASTTLRGVSIFKNAEESPSRSFQATAGIPGFRGLALTTRVASNALPLSSLSLSRALSLSLSLSLTTRVASNTLRCLPHPSHTTQLHTP
jgi:hypothetical protein